MTVLLRNFPQSFPYVTHNFPLTLGALLTAPKCEKIPPSQRSWHLRSHRYRYRRHRPHSATLSDTL
jgi:hypothetical protein